MTSKLRVLPFLDGQYGRKRVLKMFYSVVVSPSRKHHKCKSTIAITPNISSIVKLHSAGQIPLYLFPFGIFERIYEGAAVLLLANVTDVMELIVDDRKKY